MNNLVRSSVFAVAIVAVLAGCSKKKPNGGVNDDDLFGATPITDAELGIPLDGTPFDQNREPLSGTGIGPVYFGYDSSILPSSEIYKLQQAAGFLRQNPSVVLIVEGHCDERGSNEYNLSLGEQRALTLRSSLVNLGVDASRIQSRSFGEEKPAVLGSGEAVWSQNRRGEFAFYK